MEIATSQAAPLPTGTIGTFRRILGVDPVDTLPSLGRHGLSGSRWVHDTPRSTAKPVPHHVVTFQIGGSRSIGRQLGSERQHGAGPGTATLMPAGTEATFDIDGTVDVLHLYLAPSVVEDCARTTIERPDRLSLQAPFAIVDPVIAGFAHMAISDPVSAFVTSPLLRDQAAHMLAAHLIVAYGTGSANNRRSPGKLTPRQLDAVRSRVDEGLADTITLADLAQVAGLSPYHFARAFKASTGLSPYRFVQERRIDQAKSLLRTTDWPIAAIALECGFSSQSHLTYAFRIATGTTPKRWRDQD